jgi:hypothetical protein
MGEEVVVALLAVVGIPLLTILAVRWLSIDPRGRGS